MLNSYGKCIAHAPTTQALFTNHVKGEAPVFWKLVAGMAFEKAESDPFSAELLALFGITCDASDLAIGDY